jgi:acyl-coenzyme A thioesterase PaaI-like protein
MKPSISMQPEGSNENPLLTLSNPFGFGLTFHQPSADSLSATFTGRRKYEGYSGMLHGGVISALIDTVMAQWLLKNNIKAVTGELNVRFIKPIASNATLTVKTWIDSSLPPLYHLKATIHLGKTIVCKGKAKFMQQESIGVHHAQPENSGR